MAKKIMRKVLASISLVGLLAVQFVTAQALPLADDLNSETVNRTAVMLSEAEKKAAVGKDNAAPLSKFYIGQKNLAETDLFGGAYVEFQLSVSGYDKIKALVEETVSAEVNEKLPDALEEALQGIEGDEAIKAETEKVTAQITADAKAGVMQLVLGSVGDGTAVCDFFDQIEGDGVTDVRIIKADKKRVAQDDNFNWGKVTSWNLQFGEKVAAITAGAAFEAEIGVKNLRTAFFRPVPNAPSRALDILEFDPFFRSLGKGDPSATGAWSFDIFMNKNLEAADFSKAEFIEFDFYLSDYDRTMALFEGIVMRSKAFSWGISGHNRTYKAYPETYYKEQVRLAAELGSKIYCFNYCPTTEDEFAYLDKMVAEVQSYGMDVMLITDNYSLSAEEDAALVGPIAARYTMDSPHGFIKYFRIFGEQDCLTLCESFPENTPIGQEREHFKPEILDRWYLKMKAAIDAIRAANTDSRIVVSIAHLHFGFLLGMRDRGLKWDILGLDWYEDMGPFSELLDPLKELFPEYDYIICESNIRDGRNKTETEQWKWLYDGMNDCYHDDKVIGYLFYELLDEVYLTEYSDPREAYFGFLTCDARGTSARKNRCTTACRN